MNVGAVVQARMSSARLPGKVLLPLAGRPLLAWLDERLSHASSLNGHIVATSSDVTDDPVAAWAADNGVACHRGPLHDVAGRIASAARAAGFDITVRVSGDSPLLDPAVVDAVVDAFLTGDVDIATNVRPRSFPTGQSVEVVMTAQLEEAARVMSAPGHREHVLPYFYESGDRYRIRNISHHRDLSMVRMTVDTVEDAIAVEAVLTRLADDDRMHWNIGVDELADIFGGRA